MGITNDLASVQTYTITIQDTNKLVDSIQNGPSNLFSCSISCMAQYVPDAGIGQVKVQTSN